MTKRTRNLLLGSAVGFLVVAQIVPFPPANNPPVTSEIAAPPAVREVLRRSCYDCHSNETEWPWYSSVIPTKWLVRHDVQEGRGNLNFSEWDSYSESAKAHNLEEVVEMLEDGEMPLTIYTWLHQEAVLTQNDVDRLTDWARGMSPAEDPSGGAPGR